MQSLYLTRSKLLICEDVYVGWIVPVMRMLIQSCYAESSVEGELSAWKPRMPEVDADANADTHALRRRPDEGQYCAPSSLRQTS